MTGLCKNNDFFVFSKVMMFLLVLFLAMIFFAAMFALTCTFSD